ncbi:radical SAM protein [Lentzea sp. CC55]|uniref:radical SAM protein n=1 Tax=Lentzea sp. CC55 TaxID=2884909 RepID=UPI001F32A5FD|nr:radical SAM protein [Lentzea sp. CC55]MCG8921039.1 radical SAM protein [Lentzea sp. CC55]
METLFCGGCGDQVREHCAGSLATAGVKKVHWECWSHCNLRCSFCYRTTGEPLLTDEAVRLLRALRTGGANSVVFAGGDPSLRMDLPLLVSCAENIGLTPIVHTNAHHTSESLWSAYRRCDHIGLSLDSPIADGHDKMRGRRGNFDRVVGALARCDREGVRVSVRTMVSAVNVHEVHRIGPLLENHPCVHSWKLLQFSAIELGWTNRGVHELPFPEFAHAFTRARETYSGSLEMLANSEKVDAYLMVSPDGFAYGVTLDESIRDGRHRRVGSFLTEHLSTLAGGVRIDPRRHDQHTEYERHL